MQILPGFSTDYKIPDYFHTQILLKAPSNFIKKMPNYPRMFAYVSATFTVGVLVYIFTNIFLPFAHTHDWTGSIALLMFSAVYLSVAAAIARRFVSKTTVNHTFPFYLIPFLVGPMMVITALKSDFALIGDYILFGTLISAGAFYGIYLGIKAGHKRREIIIERLKQKA